MADAAIVGQIKCCGCGAKVDLKQGAKGLFARCNGAHALACGTVTHYGRQPSIALLKQAGGAPTPELNPETPDAVAQPSDDERSPFALA